MNVYLFQPQYTIIVNDKINYWIPYSVGVLWNYALQFEDIRESFELKEFIFKREPIDDILNRLDNPSVCGFSAYVWNINYCLTVAEAVKEKWPLCKIVFGGPQVSQRYSSYAFIDSIILGEGEESFVNLLRIIKNNDSIPQCINKQRLQDLSYSGPYSAGIFDSLLEQFPDAFWNITLETNRGCPYSCTFCDWGSLTYSKIKKFELENIKKEIDWIRKKPISYVMFADANFGIFRDRDLEIARLIKDAADDSSVEIINAQNAKNSTELIFEIEKIFGNKSLGVTLAAQSMSGDTLDAIKRKNLPINNIKELINLSKKYNVPTYSELIIGLPNESYDSWCDGLCVLLESGQHNSIEVWFAQLLENSEMSQPASREKYEIKSRVFKSYYHLDKHQDKDDIDESAELVVSTNTMPTIDLVRAYMFSWVIIQWHTAGYSQIIARYCRDRNNISYRSIYDHVISSISTDPVVKEKYDELEKIVDTFLNTGYLDNTFTASGHILHIHLNSWLKENKELISKFVYNALTKICFIPTWVLELQILFCCETLSTESIINADYDIFEQIEGPITYAITPFSASIKVNTTQSRRIRQNNIITTIKS